MNIFFINYYIDKNRALNNFTPIYLWPLHLAKNLNNQIYIYQGIKGSKCFKDGKICKINSDGSNTIIEGDPNNKYQKPGKHSLWIYPKSDSKLYNLLYNSDIIYIQDYTNHFGSELKKTKAYIVQEQIYSKKLEFTNFFLNCELICKVYSTQFINNIKILRKSNKKNNYNIGLIGNIGYRKGQIDFFYKLDPRRVYNYTFHIIGNIYDKLYFERMVLLCKLKGIKIKYYGELNNKNLFKSICNSKCVVHYSRNDANPRVIWESLYCGTPYYASENCKIPKIIQKFGVIDNNIEGFYKLLNMDFGDKICNFMDNELQPEKYIDNLFDKLYRKEPITL